MRDARKINAFADAFTELWEIFPYLTFWQIITIIMTDEAFKGIEDPLFVEDDKWLVAIERKVLKYFYKKRKKGMPKL